MLDKVNKIIKYVSNDYILSRQNKIHKDKLRPLIFWEGLPACSLLLKSIIKQFPSLKVVATPAQVPFEDIEALLGTKILWLKNPNDIWSRKEEFSDRNFIIHTGWSHKGWLKFGRFVKKLNKAKIIVVVDNNFKMNMRQLFGSVYYRLVLRSHFDGIFVPGREGIRLLKLLGAKPETIYVGNYGAYEGIYFDRNPIIKRKNEFLFVGQLIERKGIDILLKAFSQYKLEGGSWNLRIVGNGPFGNMCNGKGIKLEGFAQPNLVSNLMNNSKVCILPSREEHWGTVVCEAAACGMGLITSPFVGSSVDLVRNGINGIELHKLSSEHLKNALLFFQNLNNNELKNISRVSKGIARGYDSKSYSASFNKMIYDLFK